MVSMNDKEILQQLARQVRELSLRPVEAEKKQLWYRHNALEKTRPVIYCDPENGWHEIVRQEDLKCSEPLFREWEWTLKKEIFWGESLKDDKVIQPYFDIFYVYQETGWGMQETYSGGQDGGSYSWESPLKDYTRLDQLKFPEIIVDYTTTQKNLELAQEIFKDILEVRLRGAWWWTLGMTQTLVKLRGAEQVFYDFYEYPEELHKVMAFLRDGHLSKLDFLEQHNLLSLSHGGTYVGSGGFGWTQELPAKDFDGTHVRTKDIWGFGESQETSVISPQMFAEFILPYQLPILERFGLNCYGCCEPLDKRWEYVQQIPRLRRVSVSPWANLQKMADYLQNRYVYSMKLNPAPLAQPEIDAADIRQGIRDAFQITRDCNVELIMKDTHTIGNNPQNVIQWTKIAKEEAERL